MTDQGPKTKVGDWLKGKDISYGTPDEFKKRMEGGEPPDVPDSPAAPADASQKILSNRTQGTPDPDHSDLPDATDIPAIRPSTDQPSTEAAIKTLTQDWEDQNNRDDQSYRKQPKRDLGDKDTAPKLEGKRMQKDAKNVAPSDRGPEDDH